MVNYYKDSLRYIINTEQVSIIIQHRQGLKEEFREKAEKSSMSVNRHSMELVKADMDAEGKLIHLAENEKKDDS